MNQPVPGARIEHPVEHLDERLGHGRGSRIAEGSPLPNSPTFANLKREMALPADVKQPLTAKYVWAKGAVEAVCTDAAGKELRKWTYKTGDEPGAAVPPADGKERAIANLWLHESKAPQAGKPARGVVVSFGFKK